MDACKEQLLWTLQLSVFLPVFVFWRALGFWQPEILLFSCKKLCHRHILWRKPVLADSSVALVWGDIPARLQGLLLCYLPSSSEWVCSDHQCFQQPACKKASYSSPQVWGLRKIPGDVAEEQDACNRVILSFAGCSTVGTLTFVFPYQHCSSGPGVVLFRLHIEIIIC